MTDGIVIRRLLDTDAAAVWDLRLQALESAPEAFGESAAEHRRKTVDDFAERLRSGGAGSFIVGAFDGGTLVGTAGFYREHPMKRRHRGWIWGVFVAPEWRGKGVAHAMLARLVEDARAIDGLACILLSVSVTQEAARRLYRSLGFRSFGVQPKALCVDGQYYDEDQMILNLGSSEVTENSPIFTLQSDWRV
jgi:RimJ/RimL family protein N-acetyltransferase